MDTSLTDLGVCFCVKGDIVACNLSKIYYKITVAVLGTTDTNKTVLTVLAIRLTA